MNRETVLATLSQKSLSDDVFTKVSSFYPLAKECPTCEGTLFYVLDGNKHTCDCELQKLLQKHYFAANIGREYHDICLEHFIGDDRDKVVPLVQDYIDNFNDNFHYGLGITLNGPVGTGKTFAMCCILKSLVKQGRDVYFTTFDELINTLSTSWDQDTAKRALKNRLMSTEVLGLDELKIDGRNNGGFLADLLDVVLRHRTSNLLPTLITTNMQAFQEEDQFTKSYSLLSARNTRLTLMGTDLRGTAIREITRKLKDSHERRPIC